MKLVARVSAFFLASLAVVLVLFSVLLYGLARYYLYERFDRQLDTSLQTLVAAIEVEPDDVKWEPSDHTVTLGTENGVEDVRWVVVDEAALIVDQSHNLGDSADAAAILEYARRDRSLDATPPTLPQWRVVQHRLWAADPKPKAERDPLERSELVVTAALSTSELSATLGRLALALAILSPAIWLVAAAGGGWMVRRALEPLGKMAREARAIGPSHADRRLSVSASGDELSELATAFNGLLDQLFEAYDRQKRFAGDAAHQLRTPLTVLEGQIDVALRKPRPAEEYACTLTVLKDEVRELSQIIESLLFLARSGNDERPAPRQTMELSGWLADYLGKWQSHRRWPDFELDLPPALAVEASAPLLTQVLDNVLGNAAKYSPAGSTIRLSLMRSGEQAVLEIADQGIGVPAAEVEAIFRPFYRTKSARQSGQPGTGLGLTIAAQMMRALGGQLECVSETGQGARFFLRLPLAANSPLAPSNARERADRSASGQYSPGR